MRRVAKKKVSGRGAALPVYGSGQENEGGHVKGFVSLVAAISATYAHR